MATATTIITDACLECGMLDQPGQLPSAEHLAFGLTRLNRIVSMWSTRQLFIWTSVFTRFTLVAGQQSYTIGPSGANFTAARPVGIGPGGGIKFANIVIGSGSAEVLTPMALLSDEDWASLTLRGFATSIPMALYNDGGTPNSTLYLYGIPTTAYKLELWTNQQIAQFATLSDTFDWPPAYQEAATLTLAEALCNPFQKPIPDGLTEMARRARAAVTSLNSAPNTQTNDTKRMGINHGGQFDYRTGRNI